ncbi:hypothetical protein BR93DRAFT_971612 [Coniochaeta sp. PMI_546]|nr:hypothetical protein BR93DRAFT_971612 [Coniochaeta sp. PMI_546]
MDNRTAFPYRELRAKANHEDLPIVTRRRLVSLISTATILFTVTLVIILVFTLQSKHTAPNEKAPEECGTSPSSARRNNCVFDAVLMGWVPRRCYDSDLATRLLAQKEWSFYPGPDFNTTKVPLDEVLAGEWDKLYIEPGFYIAQCIATWRKTWQVAMSGGVLDGQG